MTSSLADLRRQRLAELLTEKAGGNVSELGRLIGKSPSQTHDLLSGRKSFGEKIARKIESALRVEPGLLDQREGALTTSPAAIELSKAQRRMRRLAPAQQEALLRTLSPILDMLEQQEERISEALLKKPPLPDKRAAELLPPAPKEFVK